MIKKESSKGVPVYYKGLPFPSIIALGRHLNLTGHQIRLAVPNILEYENKEVRELIETYMTGQTEYFLFNRPFKTQVEISDHFGLDSQIINGIMFRHGENRNLVEKKILEAVSSEKIIYNGVEYRDLSDFAARHKQDYQLMGRLLLKGYSIEEVLNYEIQQIKGWEISFRGQTYASKRDLLNKNGFSNTFFTSLKQFFPKESDLKIFGLYLDFVKEKGMVSAEGFLTSLPMIYYNEKYYLKAKDFYSEIGVTARNVSHEKGAKANKGLSKKQIILNLGTRINQLYGTKLFPTATIKPTDTLIFVREEFLEYAKSKLN